MSSSCVVCKGTTQCQRCEIKQLKKVIEKQNYELSYLRKDSNQQLKLPTDYFKNFETDNKFMPINYYGVMADYGFLTITFDPNKFGLFNQPKDEQNYIFHKLHKSINEKYILQLTGCFEYQKNGTTHAHLIIKSDYNNQQIEEYFKMYFTDDKKNKYAIKCYPLQKEKCEAYLQKESTEFFKYDLHFNDLDEADPFNNEKIINSASLEQVIDIIKSSWQLSTQQTKTLIKRLIKKYNLKDVSADEILEQVQRSQWKMTPLY